MRQQRLGHIGRQVGMVQSHAGLLQYRLNALTRCAAPVPKGFGDVQVLGLVLANDVRQAGTPQIFRFLLGNPGAVLPAVLGPIPRGVAEVTTRRMALQEHRPAGQGAEQHVQGDRVRVRPGGIAVPRDLDEDVGGRRRLFPQVSEEMGEPRLVVYFGNTPASVPQIRVRRPGPVGERPARLGAAQTADPRAAVPSGGRFPAGGFAAPRPPQIHHALHEPRREPGHHLFLVRRRPVAADGLRRHPRACSRNRAAEIVADRSYLVVVRIAPRCLRHDDPRQVFPRTALELFVQRGLGVAAEAHFGTRTTDLFP